MRSIATLGAMLALTLSSHAALTAGDIAIIGRTNNGAPDTFAFVALSDISAGEVIYFTDNGWTGTGYRGSTATDGDGNENLLMFTVGSSGIVAGTIIQTNTSSSNYSFTTSGTIPGASSGSFADLAQGQSGEQIYAFQNSNSSNPLFNTATQTALYAFDDTNGFENATSSSTGGIPSGLSSGTTAISLNQAVAGTYVFNTAALASGNKSEWLSAIATPANWSTGTLPSGSIAVVPEPSAPALLGSISLLFLIRRHR